MPGKKYLGKKTKFSDATFRRQMAAEIEKRRIEKKRKLLQEQNKKEAANYAKKVYNDECKEPNCAICRERREAILPSQENPELPKYYTGLRIVDVDGRVGTVIDLSGREESLPGHIAVCLDEPIGKRDYGLKDVPAGRELTNLTGSNFGMYIPTPNIQILEDQNSYDALRGIPPHIVMIVKKNKSVDSISFKAGQFGKPLSRKGLEGRMLINWYFNNGNLYDAAKNGHSVGPAGAFTHCYQVPQDMLSFGRRSGSGKVLAIWPSSETKSEKIKFQVGEYVRVTVAEPQRISNGERHYRISPGTIAKYLGATDRNTSQVALAGGCDPSVFGLAINVSTPGLEKLEEEFLAQGAEVEIAATLDFRKRDLKGLRAVVLLPLDQDGEIGLQFQEDIGAGSLDGHGPDKRCLYIHHSAVKRISE